MTVQRPGTRPLGVCASSPAHQHHRGRTRRRRREGFVHWRFYGRSVLTLMTTDPARRTINAKGVTHDHPVRHHHDPAGAVRHRVGRKGEAPRPLTGRAVPPGDGMNARPEVHLRFGLCVPIPEPEKGRFRGFPLGGRVSHRPRGTSRCTRQCIRRVVRQSHESPRHSARMTRVSSPSRTSKRCLAQRC